MKTLTGHKGRGHILDALEMKDIVLRKVLNISQYIARQNTN